MKDTRGRKSGLKVRGEKVTSNTHTRTSVHLSSSQLREERNETCPSHVDVTSTSCFHLQIH